MNKEEFKKQLSSNPKNVYCIVSTDAAIIDLYINRFKQAIGAGKVVYGSLQNSGLLLKKKNLYVIYQPKLDEAIFNSGCYVFVHTDSIDKRTSVFKKHKDQILIVENDFTDYVMSKSNMNESEAKLFIRKCNNDLGIINSELIIYNECGKSYSDYSSDPFLWADKFMKKQQLPRVEESEIGLMAILSTNCQDLLKILRDQTSGMNPYRLKCMLEMKDYRNEQELIDMTKDIFFYDCQIKRGLIEPYYALELLKGKYHVTN